MRGLARAAAYLATYTADGRRVAAPDEDDFSLLASALERVLDSGEGGTAAPEPIVVGTFPKEMDWALQAISENPGPVHHVEDGGPALLKALASAAAGEESAAAQVILASEIPERADPTTVDRSELGAGAVAFLFRPGPASGLGEHLGQIRASPSALTTAFEIYRQVRPMAPGTWVGDWEADPAAGRAGDLGRWSRFVHLSPTAVSEGAYVPRPRYRESLPSRWRFVAQKCSRCSTLTFPARGVCRGCGAAAGLTAVPLPKDRARVVAQTVIGPGGQPTEFDAQVEAGGPYEVVLADLAPGIRVTLQVTDAEPGTVRIGDRVDTRLRRLYPMDGEWRYARKAVPRPRN